MIEDKLRSVNQQFHQSGLGIQIEQRGQKLTFRATFPPKSGSNKLYQHQQRLCLGLPATPEGLEQATLLGKVLATQLWQQNFSWEHQQELRTDLAQKSHLMDVWVEEFELYFWQTRGNESRSTWEKSYLPYLKKLKCLAQLQPHSDPKEIIYQAILSTPAHSRSRQVCCTAIKALVEFMGLTLPFDIKDLWGTYSHRSLQERQLPAESLIKECFFKIANPHWRFVYGLMATFGLRNHEVFFCDYQAMQNQNDSSIRVLATTKTGSHEVWAFPPEWIEEFQLRSGQLPQIKTALTQTTLQRIGQQVTQQFKRNKIPFSPYDLRHAWAVRTIHYGLADTIAAQMMGHSVAIHNRTYHRWISRRDQEKAVTDALKHRTNQE